jgi:hypothetical protein
VGSDHSRRGKSVLARLGLSVGSAVLSLLALEIGARVVLPPQQTVTVSGLPATQPSTDPQVSISNPSDLGSLIIWGDNGPRLRPRATARIRAHRLSGENVTITTSSIGLRYDELGAKTEDEVRVLVLGDSITLCDYVSEALSYTRRMEALAWGRKRRIRFINAGMPGAATVHELALYMEIHELVEPDLVLLAMYLNDAQGAPAFAIRRLPPGLGRSRFLTWVVSNTAALEAKLAQEHHQADWLDPEWRERFRDGRALKPGDSHNDRDAYDYEIYNAHWDFGLAWNRRSWPELTKIVSLLKQAVDGDGARMAVVLFPVEFQVAGSIKESFPQDSCRAMCAELGLPFLDLRPPLRERWRADKADIYYDHCHLTPEGNRRVAEILVAWLDREGLIPKT